MLDENRKAEINKLADEANLIEKTDRVYKPTYTIEFERNGEVLVYSCDPFKHV
jgi:ribonuclease BN (tRNA processing enzyme)